MIYVNIILNKNRIRISEKKGEILYEIDYLKLTVFGITQKLRLIL